MQFLLPFLVAAAASVGAGEAVRKAEPYLVHSAARYAELVPAHSAAPTIIEARPYSSSYNCSVCPFCGEYGDWSDYGYLGYDFFREPDRVYCRRTGRDIAAFPHDGEETLVDWAGRSYTRWYYLTPHVKPTDPSLKRPLKCFPENYLAAKRIISLFFGRWDGGAVGVLADAYAATGDERYAERAIAVLNRLAEVFPSWPWTTHSRLRPLERAELLAKAKTHRAGYHGWLGPGRLAAYKANFINPDEAMMFDFLARSMMKLAGSTSWKAGEREKVMERLFREGALNFHAYGARNSVGNAIAMYAPVLHSLGTLLGDEYLKGGFMKLMDAFLYNENFHDGISAEGSPDYADMVGGMWRLFGKTGIAADPSWLAAHPVFASMGRTSSRVKTCRGGKFRIGDTHAKQYEIFTGAPVGRIPGENFGGFGLSVLRAGAADRRLEVVLHHDRVVGHAHDDMLGLQLWYRGVPLLEMFGDTRDTRDFTDRLATYADLKELANAYPRPMVTEDTRRRGFSLQDINTPLTANTVLVDDCWAENFDYIAYHGGYGEHARLPWGNLRARTGRVSESALQFVEAEGMDQNGVDGVGLDLYRRAVIVVTRPDGTPYVVDFLAVKGGHRQTFLLHSRGEEIASTLPHGAKYAHLGDIPATGAFSNTAGRATSVLFPGRVLNNVEFGGTVRGGWRHRWKFDYAAWAEKSVPLPEVRRVKPHVLGVRGFLANPRAAPRALRATGHYPVTIEEHTAKGFRRERLQFDNAVSYAGLVDESGDRLENLFVQAYECHAEDEPPVFGEVEPLPLDGGGDSLTRAALVFRFPDGARDVVFWQTDGLFSSWEDGRFATDARAALLRYAPDGKLADAVLSGGTRLEAGGKRVLAGAGVLTGRIAALEGDISGDPGKSALVIETADSWPAGAALKGETVIVGFNRGRRRESYQIDRVEKAPAGVRVHLEGSPFFIDHRGRVSKERPHAKANAFYGTETAKGGNGLTRYLDGSKIVFPRLGLTVTLEGGGSRYTGYEPVQSYIVSEDIDLAALLVDGDDFLIEPDWKGASVEFVTVRELEPGR